MSSAAAVLELPAMYTKEFVGVQAKMLLLRFYATDCNHCHAHDHRYHGAAQLLAQRHVHAVLAQAHAAEHIGLATRISACEGSSMPSYLHVLRGTDSPSAALVHTTT